MKDIRLRQAAKQDLIDIWVYSFEQWGLVQADWYLEELEKSMKMLTVHPNLGVDIS